MTAAVMEGAVGVAVAGAGGGEVGEESAEISEIVGWPVRLWMSSAFSI